MTDPSGPPFRADHVGSLLRPKNLLDARARHAAGEIDDEELRGVEGEGIAEAVGRTEAGGRGEGTAEAYGCHCKNAGASPDYPRGGLQVDGPLSIERRIFGEDFAYLQ